MATGAEDEPKGPESKPKLKLHDLTPSKDAKVIGGARSNLGGAGSGHGGVPGRSGGGLIRPNPASPNPGSGSSR